MTPVQASTKRCFDIFCSIGGLILLGWLILICAALARKSTGLNGFFIQHRVGMNGCLIPVIKIRTMRKAVGKESYVTTELDPRITTLGRFFRRTKLDELPQLVNILVGHMSFVGPRPDVVGFADKLEGEDRLILSVRPGVTGPATLAFRDEEVMLQAQEDPETYNAQVIWPQKVKMNLEYIHHYSFSNDLKIILKTLKLL